MPATVFVYTDFDGTITGVAGNKTVFTPFYQSLLAGDNRDRMRYKQGAMKDEAQVQALLSAKFGPYNEQFDYAQEGANCLMSADAVSFFRHLLGNEHVSIQLVTKNRADYIRALFRYQGFSVEAISQLQIMDSGLKNNDVASHLAAIRDLPTHVYVLDDALADLNAMVGGLLKQGYPQQQIIQINQAPGTFMWRQYLQEITDLIPAACAPERSKEPISSAVTTENAIFFSIISLVVLCTFAGVALSGIAALVLLSTALLSGVGYLTYSHFNNGHVGVTSSDDAAFSLSIDTTRPASNTRSLCTAGVTPVSGNALFALTSPSTSVDSDYEDVLSHNSTPRVHNVRQ